MSTMLVNAELISFQKIEEKNPREIELVSAAVFQFNQSPYSHDLSSI